MSTFDEDSVRRAEDGKFAPMPAAAESGVELDASKPFGAVEYGEAERVASVRAYRDHAIDLRNQLALAEQQQARHALALLAEKHSDLDFVYTDAAHGRTFVEMEPGWEEANAPTQPGDVWDGFDADHEDYEFGLDDEYPRRGHRKLDLNKVREWSTKTAAVSPEAIEIDEQKRANRKVEISNLNSLRASARGHFPNARYVEVEVDDEREYPRVVYSRTLDASYQPLHSLGDVPQDRDAEERHWRYADEMEDATMPLNAQGEHWTDAAARRAEPLSHVPAAEAGVHVSHTFNGALTSAMIDLDRQVDLDR